MAPTKTRTHGIRAYKPIEGFIANIDGTDVNFHSNIHVSERWLDDHENIRHLFEPLPFHFDVEDASAEPGRVRGE